MYPNPLNITLRNLKTFNGLEGAGFSATMYVNGELTADVIDDANGGCYSIHVAYDRKAQKQVAGAAERLQQAEDFCKTLPLVPWPADFGASCESKGYQPDLDAFLGALVDDMANQKRHASALARARKTKTLFRLKTDTDPFEYRFVKSLNVAGVKKMLDAKYGADNYEFI